MPTSVYVRDTGASPQTASWVTPLATETGGTGSGTTFTAGSVVFAGVSGVYSQDNTNFFWDNTNKRLGIRIAAPLVTLHVSDTGTPRIRVSGGTNPGFELGDVNTRIDLPAANQMTFYTGNVESFRIMNTGELRFNGAGPSSIQFADANTTLRLSAANTLTRSTAGTDREVLNSSGAFRWIAYGAGTLTTDASGNITAVSDERLKDVLGQFRAGSKALRRLKPIRYKWNRKSKLETKHQYVGFSAQNVKDAIPLAIGVNEDGSLCLQDRALLAVLVNTVNEHDRMLRKRSK